jgi:hypothetical protein
MADLIRAGHGRRIGPERGEGLADEAITTTSVTCPEASVLRTGETLGSLAAGYGVGTATAWRHATETVLSTARAPAGRPHRGLPVAVPVAACR